MKKKLALIALAAALVLSTGCANTPSEPDWSIDYSPVSYEPPSDSISNTESKGEPTFLLCPDGTPVYTSEITSVFTGSDSTGDRRDITLDEAERIARNGSNFTVICSGFVYGYYGSIAPEFGSIEELTVDTGSLSPGDSFVRAAVSIGNIGFKFNPDFGMNFEHFTLNEIKF